MRARSSSRYKPRSRISKRRTCSGSPARGNNQPLRKKASRLSGNRLEWIVIQGSESLAPVVAKVTFRSGESNPRSQDSEALVLGVVGRTVVGRFVSKGPRRSDAL